MKKLVLSVLSVTVLLGLSGCGDDNVFLYPTKAAITFAAMSSGKTPQALPSSTTGLQYAQILAAVPSYAQISSTTAPWPTTGVTGVPAMAAFPTLPPGAIKISASALEKAGVFASNSSVSKRTKIAGFYVNDLYQAGKDVVIYLVYSSPRTPGAVTVKGSSIDFAKLTVSFPAGRLMSGEIFQEMNRALWEPDKPNGWSTGSIPGIVVDYFGFYNSTPAYTNTNPTISQVILGY